MKIYGLKLDLFQSSPVELSHNHPSVICGLSFLSLFSLRWPLFSVSPMNAYPSECQRGRRSSLEDREEREGPAAAGASFVVAVTN